MNLQWLQPHRPKALLALLLSGGVLAQLVHSHRPMPAPSASIGMPALATAQHFLDQSEPICVALAAPTQTLRLTAQPVSDQNVPGWKVLCTTRNGQEVAQLLWNAHSHTLVSVSAPPTQAVGASLKLPTSHSALVAAHILLGVLGQNEAEGGWHLACRQVRVGSEVLWVVKCVGVEQQVRLNLDARSGLLSYALISSPEGLRAGSGGAALPRSSALNRPSR
jgi:hypothetical protein